MTGWTVGRGPRGGPTAGGGLPPVAAPGWPGDPGDGKYVIGWGLGPASEGYASVASLRANQAGWTGDATVSVIHDYNPDGFVNETKLNNAWSQGFNPSLTFKGGSFNPGQIASGAADAQIDASAAICASYAPRPVDLCYWHEPENDIEGSNTIAQQQYRAAGRRIALRFAAAGVTNVAWMPIYMAPFTFSGSGRDWHNWHPDWQANGGWYDTITQHVMGLDVYCPVPPSTNTRTFPYLLDLVFDQVEQPGNPVWDYVIPEFGLSNEASNPSRPDWLAWAQEAVTYAKARRIKGFTYWDNRNNATYPSRYSFDAVGDPDLGFGAGRKLQGWQHIVSQSAKKAVPA